MYTLSYARHIRKCGYTKRIPVVGGPGASELGIHVGASMREDARFALVHANYPAPGTHYAYVVFADGYVLDGCFHLFSDGRFNLT